MDDRYASLALSYLRGTDHQGVLEQLNRGVRPAVIVQSGSFIPPDKAQAKELKSELVSLRSRIEKSLDILDELGIRIVALGQECYPHLLAEIPSPPAFLYILGDTEKLSFPQIAIVGSRTPSRAGLRQTFEMAGELISGGFAITSGLALGIDGAAHRGALDKNGCTLAVMGTGLDQVYPVKHRKLANQIRENGGTLVSEFPPGTPPRRENFPRRNRIVSGLACATVVVEAQSRSGSLITARLAADQGRTVCAVPGGINDPLKDGCHHLIREGAVLVRNSVDIAEAAASLVQSHRIHAQLKPSQYPRHSSPLLAAMGVDPHSFEKLLELSGQSASELARTLGELEISGEVYRSAEGYRRTY